MKIGMDLFFLWFRFPLDHLCKLKRQKEDCMNPRWELGTWAYCVVNQSSLFVLRNGALGGSQIWTWVNHWVTLWNWRFSDSLPDIVTQKSGEAMESTLLPVSYLNKSFSRLRCQGSPHWDSRIHSSNERTLCPDFLFLFFFTNVAITIHRT